MTPISGIGSMIQTGLQQISGSKALSSSQGISPADLKALSSSTAPSTTSAASSSNSFGDMLSNMVGEVNSKQVAANDAMSNLVAGGKDASLHQTMIAIQEARVSFQLMVEVRNKMLDSYKEIMQMQV